MASDDDDDLIALRQAALATMKKKPAAADDVQPIPQLTTSGHSLNNARPSWAENDFNYDDHVPFQDHEPAGPGPFPPLNTHPPPQFNHPPPVQFPPNNWPGPRPPGMGPVHQGNFLRFGRGRGSFPPNHRPPFGQNKRPRFGKRGQFLPNQRPPFSPNQRLPFSLNQPRFGQDPGQYAGGPPPGAGNLIVINTVPEGGTQLPGFPEQIPPFPDGIHPGQRPPFPGGVNPGQRLPFQGGTNPGRPPFQGGINPGRPPFPGGVNPGHRPPFPCGDNQWGGRPPGAGTGGGIGQSGNLPPGESSSKPLLLRPQDKYCPPEDDSNATPEEPKEPVHRKKKDKFSRYNSSDDDSDDESEEESETELPPRRRSVGSRETVEKEIVGSEDLKDDPTVQSQSDKNIPEAELSIIAMNSSQVDSDPEHAEPELEEPVIDNLGEPGIDGLGEPVIGNLGDGEQESEPELNEEDEDRLLASPSRQSDSGSNRVGRCQDSSENEGTPVRDESPLRDESPVGDESPAREVSSGSETPVRDESFDADATPIRDESPERDLSPEGTESPEKEDSDQNRSSSQQSGRGEGDDHSGDSESDNGSDTENNSDSSGDSSSSGSSSGKGTASKSVSDSASQGSKGKKAAESSDEDSDSDAEVADVVSSSESDEDRSVRRLPSKNTPRLSTNSRPKSLPSSTKPKAALTPEEQARLEARRRKFESREEVKVAGSKRTISLKAITSSNKTSKDSNSKKQNDKPVKNLQAAKSSSRTVQAKTSVTKPNDVDVHHKHSRRKVSIEKAPLNKSDSNSEIENKSDSEEDDDEDGGSRSWMREANRNAVRHKTVVNQSLRGSGRCRDQSYRGGNRNGGYYRRERGSLKASQPEVHYSSSDNDDQDSDRRLISIVVPRSEAGTHRGYSRPRPEANVKRSFVPNRKRTAEINKFDRESDRHSHPKSKRSQEYGVSSDRTGGVSVVIAGDHSPSRVSQASRGRIPVHQRLGKNNRRPKDSPRSGSSTRREARNQSDSASGDDGNRNELDQRIRLIQRKNKAIMRRQKEVLKDRELYG